MKLSQQQLEYARRKLAAYDEARQDGKALGLSASQMPRYIASLRQDIRYATGLSVPELRVYLRQNGAKP